ncbi:hypothetical protein GALMADRAFT_1313197 [Galerina marginata CBS 339.88]|uniref:F-box domain-containing protein n=1 Tax=Galerina marginata (strain CBS 339.88) TaxID=685588 RepID=A0A067T7H9_GALM3|nr:hypothetical protein GALMADRAFT_1313197 [Galerina marginata CBS 339.88]
MIVHGQTAARTLPFDIFYAIFSVIATMEDGFDTLKSCSLTCKALHPLCQRHLFTDVVLPPCRDSHEPTLYSAQFAAILEGKPEIANLRNVENLEITTQGEEVHWSSIYNDLQRAIIRIIQSPKVAHLSLRLFSGLPIASILMPCTGLIGVELNLLSDPADTLSLPLAMESPSLPVDDVKMPRPEKFSIKASSTAAMLLLEPKRQHGHPMVDLTHLTDLSFELEDLDDRILAGLILQSSLCLKTLRCEVVYAMDFAGILQKINPASKKTLEYLEFFLEIENEVEDPLFGLPQELDYLSGKNQIQGLIIEVLVTTDCICSTRVDDWNKLETVLTADSFPSLRNVTIEVTISRSMNTESALRTRLLTMSQEAFRDLKCRPLVQLDFAVIYEYV